MFAHFAGSPTRPSSRGSTREYRGARAAMHMAICLLGTGVLGSPASAQNAAWIDPSGGSYEDAGNWSTPGVPGAANNVLINVGTSYNIEFGTDHTAGSLAIASAGALDLTFSSGGPGTTEYLYTINGSASINRARLTLGDLTQGRLVDMEVGGMLDMEGGRLSLLNGAQLTSQTSSTNSNIIDGAGGVQSQILVRGESAAGQPSRWESVGGTILGDSGGPASLAILDGGQVSSGGTVALGTAVMADGSSLEVRGTTAAGVPSSLASNAFRLGFVGSGGGLSRATAQVAAGGLLSTGAAEVRRDSLVVVDGEGATGNPSQWQAGSVSVPGGFVDVTGGGYVSSAFVNLGRLAIARINGAGASGRPSQWDIAGSLRLGSSDGFGSMLIDRGHVTSETAEIGLGSGESLLSVAGTAGAIGTWENSGNVWVGGSLAGPDAQGNLRTVDNHARVHVGGTLTVWGPGTVQINGGEMTADVVNHTAGGSFDFNAGKLSVNRFNGDLVNVAGTISPGVDDPTGGTIIDGSYTQQSGGTLAIDIGGTGAGSTYDLINLNGDAQVDGLLSVILRDGFTPNPSSTFTVLASGTLSGFFDNVATGQRLDTVDGRGSFVVNYGIGSDFIEDRIVLSNFESSGILPGDYNDDGTVDIADYTVWRDNLGAAITLPGDSSPGMVSPGDYDIWKLNFGVSSTTSSLHASSIPEPAAVWLLLVGSGCWLVAMRRR